MPAVLCPPDEDLKAYAWGELPLQHEDELADHLETCPRCESVVQTLERRGDPLLARLRMPMKPDPYLDEPECRQVVQRLLNRAIPNDEQVIRPYPPPLACPGRFREYELLEKLGEGGMGTVYKAQHQQLKKFVAIKILLPGPAQDPQRIARFKREMKAVGQLDNPHVVRAMDAGEADSRHYLVMEYVEGLDLSKVIDRIGPLAVADACEIVRQISVGLRAADERGLIHRDIKPSNLMLTPDGRAKILDLGLAVFETDHTPDGETTAYGQIVGTPDYIAPEQINDAHSVDARADIYSLGCTLYKLLTGQAPFAGPRYKSAAQKMTAHLHDTVPPIRTLVPQVPEKLVAVLDRMLAKDRDLRIPTPGRLVDELATFCVGSDLAGLLALALNGLPAGSERTRPHADVTTAFPQDAPLRHEEGQEVRTDSPPASDKLQSPQGPSGAKPVVAAVVNMNKDTKQENFDPYHKWLGIPPEEQPANHYRLLGLQVFERDPEVILAAVMRQSAHLKTYQLGQHAALTQKLLTEVSAAKVCLLDPQRKATYDARLRKELDARKTPAPPQSSRLPTAQPLPSDLARRVSSAPPAPVAEPTIDPGLENLFAEFQQDARPSGSKAKKQPPAPKRPAKSSPKWSFKWPPKSPRNRWLIAAGAAGLILAGVIFIIKDKYGKEIARVNGETVVVEPEPKPKPDTAPEPMKAPFDAKQAQAGQDAWAKYLGVLSVAQTNSIGMKLVLIPPGEFMMGSPKEVIEEELKAHGDDGWFQERVPSEGPQHRVRITSPYWLGATDITQEEYQRVMGSDPNKFQGDAKKPVEQVSWDDAVEFCRKLSKLPAEKAAKRRYSLPTEAQWEYACRAGTKTRLYSGDDDAGLVDVAWFSTNAGGQTHPVGQKKPNAWGLYDMHGNVWQWCQDWYDKDYYWYEKLAIDDPTGPSGGSFRVLRGGTWDYNAGICRSAVRSYTTPEDRSNHTGFRVCYVPVPAIEQAAVPAKPIVPAIPVPLDLKTDAKAWDLKPGSPLNRASLVVKPAVIKGLVSWTVETSASRNLCWGGVGQLSPNDKWYAAAGRDGVIRLLDPATGKLQTALANPELDVTSLTWSPDNAYVAVGCRTGMVRIWNVAKGTLVIGPPSSSTNQVSSLAWSPDGTLLAIARWGESAVVLWDVREAKQSAVLQEPADANRSVCFLVWSADGKQLMATSDLAVRIWDVAGAKLDQTLDLQTPEDQQPRRAAAWSPDGKRIATLCNNGKVKFFDSTYKRVLSGQIGYPYGDISTSIAWSPDGRHLVGGYLGGCVVISTESGADEFSSEVLHIWYDKSYGFSWSKDSTRFFCTQNNSGTVTVFDIDSKKPLWQLAGNLHYGGTGICISPDGRQYATAVTRDRLYTWDAMRGTPARDYGPIFPNGDQVAWSKDGRLAVAGGGGSWGDPGGCVWNTGESGQGHVYHDGGCRCAAWSPDGKTLARGETDILIWTSGKEDPRKVFHADSGVAKLVWVGNNSTLAAGLDNNKVLILEMPSGKVLRTLEREGLDGGIRYLAVLADGRLVAASGNGAVSVWNSKWETVGDLARLGLDIRDGAMPVGGTMIAFATSDGIVLCDAQKLAVRKEIGTGPTYSVAWSLPLHRLFAVQDDRIAIYDVPSGELLASQVIWWGPGKHMLLSPEGHVRMSPAMSEDVVYVALTDDGRQVTLRPAEFAATYDWKNDPEKIRLSYSATTTDMPPVGRAGKALEPEKAQGTANVPLAFFPMDEASWKGWAPEVTDATGKGCSCTAHGGANTIPDSRFGRVGSFNGDGQRVKVGGSQAIAGARSIVAWVKVPAFSGLGMPLVTGGKVGRGDFFGIAGDDRGYTQYNIPRYALFIDHWGTLGYHSDNVLAPDKWTHVAFTYDGSGTLSFYIDGRPAGTVSSAHLYDYDINTMVIGGNTIGGSSMLASLKGLLCGVGIYRSQLSAEQILALYTSQLKALSNRVQEGAEKVPGTVVLLAQVTEEFVCEDGSFVVHSREGKSEWLECSPDGSPGYRFAETGRDKDWIRIFDAGRNLTLRLPVGGGMGFSSTDDGKTWNGWKHVVKKVPGAVPPPKSLTLAKRFAAPDKESQAQAMKEIRKAFPLPTGKNAYNEAELSLLADKLLQTAYDPATPAAARFVAFDQARQSAIKAGNFTLAIDAIDQMGQVFDIDAVDVKLETIQAALRTRGLPAALRGNLAADGSNLADDALAAHKPEQAQVAARIALTQAIAAKNAELGRQVREQVKIIDQVVKNHAEVDAPKQRPARRIVNAKDSSTLVLIPAGEFLAGEERFTVRLPAFYLGLTKVTNAQYKRFMDETGYGPPGNNFSAWPPDKKDRPNPAWDGKNIRPGFADHPVTCVSGYDADEYCRWAGLRLPSELEWQKAARGTDGRKYPWGNESDPSRYFNKTNRGDKMTCPVLSFPGGRSPWGLYNMSGNAWEWCAEPMDGKAWERYRQGDLTPPTEGIGLWCGGSQADGGDDVSCTRRGGNTRGCGWAECGFRVAKSVEPAPAAATSPSAAPSPAMAPPAPKKT